jgi:3-deoxy-D-manno-octulosonic-acid transferase
MGLWYRLADVAFLGGSMVPRGGQNPIEPAKLMVPIVHGRHVSNFREVYDALAAADAVTAVGDANELADVVKRLIQNPGERERLSRNARACVDKLAGALDRTVAALEPYLAPLSPNEASKRS